MTLSNNTGNKTVTATSSNTGQVQVSPGSANISGSGYAVFTITVKKQNGHNVTFESSCGSQQVTVTIP